MVSLRVSMNVTAMLAGILPLVGLTESDWSRWRAKLTTDSWTALSPRCSAWGPIFARYKLLQTTEAGNYLTR